ncbi:MAG: 4'-phosphopantetheinyl transferase superfamily protein, partial [Lachnospiraceae bacterium]|nr:4'-phosphopantetheinyl transferase superfamily protein [Lachnospiraceae bacterium]
IKTYIMDVRQLESEGVFDKALQAVSPYRRQKIALLKHKKDKNRSLGAALSLNAALKAYDLEERSMEYDLEKQGKPVFRYYPEIHFSLSHSGDFAICSIGEEEIGNDIERVRSGKERVAERFFAKEELSWIQNTESSEEKDARIFRIWTIKESFLKVTGLGMSLPLKDFVIVIEKNNPISVHQQINDKIYHIKEYTMPEFYHETTDYKISICCANPDFSPEIETVTLS